MVGEDIISQLDIREFVKDTSLGSAYKEIILYKDRIYNVYIIECGFMTDISDISIIFNMSHEEFEDNIEKLGGVYMPDMYFGKKQGAHIRFTEFDKIKPVWDWLESLVLMLTLSKKQ